MEQGSQVDLLIVGGGIQGMAIASEAARGGLRVMLCDKNDFGSATSSASSKLIHGGLRYLEHGAFSLVKESLRAQKRLRERAPHLVQPLLFYLPYHPSMRSSWIIRIGLALYDVLGGRRDLPSSTRITFSENNAENPLKPAYHFGFQYADCQVEDTRMVMANALDAHEFGASLQSYTECIELQQQNDGWRAVLRNAQYTSVVHAKAVVNATGPWVAQFLASVAQWPIVPKLRLVQGSHILVPKLYSGHHAYLLQNSDQRIIFVIPYQDRYSLIGTTDVPFEGNLSEIRSSVAEETYLLQAVSQYFQQPLQPSDIQHRWSGVRALLDDGHENPAAIGREYHVIHHNPNNNHPLISIYGGKLTTHHTLAVQVIEQLMPYFPHLTQAMPTPLPGGRFPDGNPLNYLNELMNDYDWLPPHLLSRYVHQYGTRCEVLLAGCHNMSDLGKCFGHELYEKELKYLIKHEWAKTASDVLWRRTRLGFSMSEDECVAITKWMAAEGY
ncbi:MAG: glycerol-3-phosphate dehydrogenase [Pseudomonadota bacterium]